MTIIVLPTAHIVQFGTIVPHLMPQVVILLTTHLQLVFELTIPRPPTLTCHASTWFVTVNQEVSTEHFPHVPVQDILLQHAMTKVQGVLLAQLTASAVNNDIEIVVESPCEGIGQASVLRMR
jgi:hypothetical protein